MFRIQLLLKLTPISFGLKIRAVPGHEYCLRLVAIILRKFKNPCLSKIMITGGVDVIRK